MSAGQQEGQVLARLQEVRVEGPRGAVDGARAQEQQGSWRGGAERLEDGMFENDGYVEHTGQLGLGPGSDGRGCMRLEPVVS